jgi:hypothetical protein
MRNPLPKVTDTGRVGVFLSTLAASKLDPSPVLLYGLAVLGAMLILCEAVIYAPKLARHIRFKSYQGSSTFSRPSSQPFGVRKDGAR